MKLVEQHLIRKSDPRFAVIDQAAFAAKNLYNQANYQIRQQFFAEGTYLPYTAIFHRLKHHDAYCALPRKVSNSILIQLHTNWVAFFRANEAYKEDPSKFLGRPKIPGYDGYMVEVVYQRAEEQAAVDRKLVAAIDLGVNVLAAVTSTKQSILRFLRAGDRGPAVTPGRLAV